MGSPPRRRGEAGPAAHCIFAATDRAVYAYDLRAPALVLRQPAQMVGTALDEVGQLALSEDGLHLAAADDAGAVHVFDLAAGRAPVVGRAFRSVRWGVQRRMGCREGRKRAIDLEDETPRKRGRAATSASSSALLHTQKAGC